MSETVKSYILAIPLPEDKQEELSRLSPQAQVISPSIKTGDNRLKHLTLLKLGQQSENRLDEIERLVREKSDMLAGVDLVVDRLDAFPEKDDGVRTLYLGVKYNEGLLRYRKWLQKRLRGEKLIQGNDRDPFVPHFTVAKVPPISRRNWISLYGLYVNMARFPVSVTKISMLSWDTQNPVAQEIECRRIPISGQQPSIPKFYQAAPQNPIFINR